MKIIKTFEYFMDAYLMPFDITIESLTLLRRRSYHDGFLYIERAGTDRIDIYLNSKTIQDLDMLRQLISNTAIHSENDCKLLNKYFLDLKIQLLSDQDLRKQYCEWLDQSDVFLTEKQKNEFFKNEFEQDSLVISIGGENIVRMFCFASFASNLKSRCLYEYCDRYDTQEESIKKPWIPAKSNSLQELLKEKQLKEEQENNSVAHLFTKEYLSDMLYFVMNENITNVLAITEEIKKDFCKFEVVALLEKLHDIIRQTSRFVNAPEFESVRESLKTKYDIILSGVIEGFKKDSFSEKSSSFVLDTACIGAQDLMKNIFNFLSNNKFLDKFAIISEAEVALRVGLALLKQVEPITKENDAELNILKDYLNQLREQLYAFDECNDFKQLKKTTQQAMAFFSKNSLLDKLAIISEVRNTIDFATAQIEKAELLISIDNEYLLKAKKYLSRFKDVVSFCYDTYDFKKLEYSMLQVHTAFSQKNFLDKVDLVAKVEGIQHSIEMKKKQVEQIVCSDGKCLREFNFYINCIKVAMSDFCKKDDATALTKVMQQAQAFFSQNNLSEKADLIAKAKEIIHIGEMQREQLEQITCSDDKCLRETNRHVTSIEEALPNVYEKDDIESLKNVMQQAQTFFSQNNLSEKASLIIAKAKEVIHIGKRQREQLEQITRSDNEDLLKFDMYLRNIGAFFSSLHTNSAFNEFDALLKQAEEFFLNNNLVHKFNLIQEIKKLIDFGRNNIELISMVSNIDDRAKFKKLFDMHLKDLQNLLSSFTEIDDIEAIKDILSKAENFFSVNLLSAKLDMVLQAKQIKENVGKQLSQLKYRLKEDTDKFNHYICALQDCIDAFYKSGEVELLQNIMKEAEAFVSHNAYIDGFSIIQTAKGILNKGMESRRQLREATYSLNKDLSVFDEILFLLQKAISAFYADEKNENNVVQLNYVMQLADTFFSRNDFVEKCNLISKAERMLRIKKQQAEQILEITDKNTDMELFSNYLDSLKKAIEDYQKYNYADYINHAKSLENAMQQVENFTSTNEFFVKAINFLEQVDVIATEAKAIETTCMANIDRTLRIIYNENISEPIVKQLFMEINQQMKLALENYGTIFLNTTNISDAYANNNINALKNKLQLLKVFVIAFSEIKELIYREMEKRTTDIQVYSNNIKTLQLFKEQLEIFNENPTNMTKEKTVVFSYLSKLCKAYNYDGIDEGIKIIEALITNTPELCRIIPSYEQQDFQQRTNRKGKISSNSQIVHNKNRNSFMQQAERAADTQIISDYINKQSLLDVFKSERWAKALVNLAEDYLKLTSYKNKMELLCLEESDEYKEVEHSLRILNSAKRYAQSKRYTYNDLLLFHMMCGQTISKATKIIDKRVEINEFIKTYSEISEAERLAMLIEAIKKADLDLDIDHTQQNNNTNATNDYNKQLLIKAINDMNNPGFFKRFLSWCISLFLSDQKIATQQLAKDKLQLLYSKLYDTQNTNSILQNDLTNTIVLSYTPAKIQDNNTNIDDKQYEQTKIAINEPAEIRSDDGEDVDNQQDEQTLVAENQITKATQETKMNKSIFDKIIPQDNILLNEQSLNS